MARFFFAVRMGDVTCFTSAARMSLVESYFSEWQLNVPAVQWKKLDNIWSNCISTSQVFWTPKWWWKVNTWDLLFQGKSKFGEYWLFSPGWNSFLPSRNPTWTQRKFTNDRGRWRVLLYLLPAIRLDWRSFAGASSTSHTFASSNFPRTTPFEVKAQYERLGWFSLFGRVGYQEKK